MKAFKAWRLSVLAVVGALAVMAVAAGGTSAATSAEPAAKQTKAATQEVTVAVAGTFLGYGPLYVAQRAALFKKRGLRVKFTLTAGGPQAFAAILSGDAQFSTTTLTEVSNANLQGQAARIIAPQIRSSQIECFARKDIASSLPARTEPLNRRVQALRGKTVGVTSVGGGVSIFVSYLLKAAGMVPSDIKMIAIGASPPAWVAAMENKRLDAMCVGLPIPEVVAAAGFATPYIVPGRGDVPILKGLPESNIVATADYISKNPGIVKKFVGAMYDAQLLIQKNRTAAARMIKNSAFATLEQPVFDQAWNNFTSGFAITPVISPAALTTALTFAKFAIPNSAGLTAAQLYDGRFAKAVVADRKKALAKAAAKKKKR